MGLPVVPLVCVLIAIAVVSGVSLLRRFDIPRWARTALIVALTVVAILPPTIGAVQFVRQHSRKSTQALAYAWITANVPPGSGIAVETRALSLPEERYRVEHTSRLIRRDNAGYLAAGIEFVLASSTAYGPIFEAPQNRPAEYAAYRHLFDQATLVMAFDSSAQHPGPDLRLYRLSR